MASQFDELRTLLEEEVEDEPAEIDNFAEESDIDSEDEVEQCILNSETEQSENEIEEDDKEEGNSFMGKDKKTEWLNKPLKKSRRRKSHNICIHLPGVIGNAKNAKTPYECWNNFFTDNVIELIVTYTNIYIDSVKDRFVRQRDIKSTDAIEVKAFIGLLYLAGVYRANRMSLEDLWGKEGDGIEKFSLVMSLKRFNTLICCLRFDDRRTRNQRKENDRLAPVRIIFEKFVDNCQKSFSPGENLTIDEMLPGFRGRCQFRQYIPSKPNKYGVKLYSLVDASMFYTVKMEIYAGQQPQGPFCFSNKPSDVVMRMAEPLFGFGRNITADNWFTSFDLIDKLKTMKLSYVVLVSYIPRERKNVILVSSLHDDDAIDPQSGEQMKPEIITFYNLTKCGVDVADQMCASYNVSRNTRRWPMVIFYTILNVAGINSQVIYIGNNLEKKRRRLFLKELSHELVLEHLQRRSMNTVGIPNSLHIRMQRFRPRIEQEKSQSPPTSKRRRCVTCTLETGVRRLS
nr:piggyBac transposable element-derived protein 4-like [Hydra vulgaris]